MARERNRTAFRYRDVRARLRDEGPQRLYLLWGEEAYLRDSFMKELRAACLAPGSETFNLHRLRGPAVDMQALRDAAEAMPFMGERSYVELRDPDINRPAACDPAALKEILADLPPWVTVVFALPPGYKPNGTLSAVRALRKAGTEVEFTSPPESELVTWVERRAGSQGKSIGPDASRYLLRQAGTDMTTLVQEITKLCGAADGDEITRADIDRVIEPTPEVTVFQMTDALGAGDYDRAASLMAVLLGDRDTPPSLQISLVGEQLRRLYAARTALDFGLADSYIADCVPMLEKYPSWIRSIRQTSRRFSRGQLQRALRLCAETEFGMKDNGPDPENLMRELLVRLALDRA